jgi:hypothetical protein
VELNASRTGGDAAPAAGMQERRRRRRRSRAVQEILQEQEGKTGLHLSRMPELLYIRLLPET